MKRRLFFWSAVLFLGLAGSPASATMFDLPAAPPFSWGSFGGGLTISPITAREYVSPGGVAGASVDTLALPVYARHVGAPDGDPTLPCDHGHRCEQIGNASFEFALWRGSQPGSSLAINRVGAAIFGGFQLTDAAELGSNYSFLQIYSDAFSPAGTIDGGGYTGKVNGQIPRYNANPGWNYGGSIYQYDFFDVPFDRVGQDPAEQVSFETALVNVDLLTSTLTILADFTWSFTTAAGVSSNDFLTGALIASAAAPSSGLLDLYSSSFPGVTYRNGIVTIDSVPEPPGWMMFATALFAWAWIAWRRNDYGSAVMRPKHCFNLTAATLRI